jgi:hypothetical protein
LTNKPTNEDLLQVREEVKNFIEQKAVQLGTYYLEMFKKLNPKQRDFVLKMATIKAFNYDDLTLEEKLYVGDMLQQASTLNIEITNEVTEFWNKFTDIAKQVALTFADIGIKIAVKLLTAYIPIPTFSLDSIK